MQKCIFLNIWFCLWMILPFLQLAANVHSEDRLFAEGLWDDARIGYESSTPFTSVSPPFLSKSDLLRRQICLAACCLEEDDPTRCLQALPYSRRSFWGPSFYLYVKALRQSGQTKQALQTLLFSSSKQITSSPLLLHAFAGEVYLACAKLFTPSLERLKQTISSAKSFLKRGKPRLFTFLPLSNPYLFYVCGM